MLELWLGALGVWNVNKRQSQRKTLGEDSTTPSSLRTTTTITILPPFMAPKTNGVQGASLCSLCRPYVSFLQTSVSRFMNTHVRKLDDRAGEKLDREGGLVKVQLGRVLVS